MKPNCQRLKWPFADLNLREKVFVQVLQFVAPQRLRDRKVLLVLNRMQPLGCRDLRPWRPSSSAQVHGPLGCYFQCRQAESALVDGQNKRCFLADFGC